MKKLVASLLFLLVFISGNHFNVIAQTELDQALINQTSVAGRVIGVIMVPPEETKNIPEDVKSKKMGKEYFIDFSDGSREIRVGIEGWLVSVTKGSRTISTETDHDGNFVLQEASSGTTYLTLSFQGVTLLKQRITFVPKKSKVRDIMVTITMEDLKNMGHSGKASTKKDRPCLDNNFLCKYFIGSDCYKNLMNGNPFCWMEAMDDSSARWCNGKRNCSVFILHSQKKHCDLIP